MSTAAATYSGCPRNHHMDGIAWEQQHFLSTLNSETHMLGRSKLRKVSTRKFTRISYCSTRATRAANDISTRREAVMVHEFHFSA